MNKKITKTKIKLAIFAGALSLSTIAWCGYAEAEREAAAQAQSEIEAMEAAFAAAEAAADAEAEEAEPEAAGPQVEIPEHAKPLIGVWKSFYQSGGKGIILFVWADDGKGGGFIGCSHGNTSQKRTWLSLIERGGGVVGVDQWAKSISSDRSRCHIVIDKTVKTVVRCDAGKSCNDNEYDQRFQVMPLGGKSIKPYKGEVMIWGGPGWSTQLWHGVRVPIPASREK